MKRERVSELAFAAASSYQGCGMTLHELIDRTLIAALDEAFTEPASQPMIDAGYETGAECQICITTVLHCSEVYNAMCKVKRKDWSR